MKNAAIQFKVENLGPLATGTLRLADLTVICGENNTGKTYLTYALYGLLKRLTTFIVLPEFDISALREYGILEIDLKQHIVSQSEEILREAVEVYRKNLHHVLAAQEARFDHTHLELGLNFDGVLTREYHNSFTSERGRRIVSFDKAANSNILIVNAVNEDAHESNNRLQYQRLIERAVTEICFEPVIPHPFIVSTERTGVVMFKGDINLASYNPLGFHEEIEERRPIRSIAPGSFGGYPMPVHDNVSFINSLSGIQTQDSELLKTHPDILNDFEALIGGSYKWQNHNLYFVPKGTGEGRLQMSESSSAVRSLVILGYYLKHLAKPGDLLMIDEPELNLHPANQRKMARLLARLVNAGIRVLATTHSDYIVKELNTLIMRHYSIEHGKKLPKDSRYTEQDILSPERVRVYMLREDSARKNGHTRKLKALTLCEADISPTFGIEASSFDETIEDMNAMQESLYYEIEYAGKA